MKAQDNKNSRDILFLSVTRVLTILGNLLSVMLLSHHYDLESYGTYSAGNLIISVLTSISALGFVDAVNYYYNSAQIQESQDNKYLNTIVALQFISGSVAGIVLLLCRNSVISYFGNARLSSLMIYLAVCPLLENLSSSLLVLQAAIGKANAVAKRNFGIMLLRLMSIFAVVHTSRDIEYIFLITIILDLLTLFYYYGNFRVHAYRIRPYRFDPALVGTILRYSIPMGVYIMAGSLMRDTDKLVISWNESVGSLAIYTNCSAKIPVGILASSCITVILPIVTRKVQRRQSEEVVDVMRSFYSVAVVSTLMLASVCIIFAPELIRVLYGEKYVPGVSIFLIYLMFDVVFYSSTTIVLTADGQTRFLMKLSLALLFFNAVLNVLLYKVFRMVGPALASLLVSIASAATLLKRSSIILKIPVLRMIDHKAILISMFKLAVLCMVTYTVKSFLLSKGISSMVSSVFLASAHAAVSLAVSYKTLRESLRVLNTKD